MFNNQNTNIMKKIFLLIPALVLALVANADVIEITPTSPHSSNNLRQALAAAGTGDIIEMAAGTYVETGNWLAVDDKEVTVRPAEEGAEVIIKPQFSVRVKAPNAAAKAEFIGVKFDCSTLESSELFVPSDNQPNQSVVLDNCELYNWSANSALIHSTSSRKLDVISINNCYFHGFEKSIVFVENANLVSLSITNSTFANVSASVTDSYWAAPIYVKATSGSVLVDHCTFYNVNSMSLSYGTITVEAIADPVISNCIFMLPATIDMCATNLQAGGSVLNTLTYNYDNWQDYGHYNTATKTNCIKANPLFNDLANNRYTYDGNWNTMSISPARGAATDGTDLGDPRWYSDEVLPSTDFASAYDLLGTKAVLSGRIELNANNKIHFKNTSDVVDGTAIWKLHVEKSCAINALVDVEAGCTSGRQLTLTVKDADGNTIATLAQASATYNEKDIDLGQIVFSEAGDYTFILTNSLPNSGVVLEKIILTYDGRAVIPISPSANTTLNVADAWFTSSCIREDEKIEYHTDHANAWVKWNIATSATAFYDIEVNIETTNAHEFAVNIYEDENVSPVATVSEEYNSANGTLELGRVNLIGGKNFVVKVTNITSGSKAKLVSVVFKPVVSSAITLPGTIDFSKATKSDLAFIQEGKLYFNEIGDSNPVGQWAQWEVTTDHNGTFLFTMAVSSTNSQTYKITIYDDVLNEVAEYEKNPGGSGDQTLTHYFYLGAGNYFVKVENTHAWSQGHLVSLVITEPALLSLDQTAITKAEDLEPYVDQAAQDIQIIRTFKGNTYNTICLPFGVSSSKVPDVFGSDVILKKLSSSALDETGSILDLNFETVTSGIYQGTPYLIKPKKDIVNPVFKEVVIKATSGSNTNTDYVRFVGTLIASEVPAGEENLFVGPEDKLYFSKDAATPIKAFRGWFVLHDIPGGPSFIKAARIVAQEEEVTAVELVNSENNSRKVIENGQLIIIRDGVRYNVMGIVIEK
ncbi:MAG: DUF4957 domain-containing protein [Paludibacteraceae bacterium]|nr:DUF4957 domain-containing protein [Paludibacteraceae bacterium]